MLLVPAEQHLRAPGAPWHSFSTRELTAQVGISEVSNCKTWYENAHVCDIGASGFSTMRYFDSPVRPPGANVTQARSPPRPRPLCPSQHAPRATHTARGALASREEPTRLPAAHGPAPPCLPAVCQVTRCGEACKGEFCECQHEVLWTLWFWCAHGVPINS